ncbi:DUF1707 domain-containing protein [Actinospica durhamensis]|uniref:DUF1707 domain-containing protein n=1 Tax=Actinospica durhamensis TaxID=1508375 RepID=A0A941EVQ2_9ACTN|nr:DUF1707 domain-containing protein [Actinospica durhamensis]MBR7834799.1 DUF1707 domain-containing protein [Actinospica durhamensis]
MTEDRLPQQRPELRASHADRDRVAEQLRIAAGDGRLTMDELDERLDKALNARTGSELELLLLDLPAVAGPGSGLLPAVEAKELVRIEVTSGNANRQGRWAVPQAMSLRVRSGNIKLDLTEAVVSGPVLKLDVDVRSGNIVIVTRPGIEVMMDEVNVRSGNVKVRVPKEQASVPAYLRVEVVGSVGSGNVLARPPRRGFMDWLRSRPIRYPELPR